MTNYLALQLDRRGVAQMSCIAGVGGDVPALVKLARSGRPVVALDGCPLHCVERVLARHGVTPVILRTLTEDGVAKRAHQDFDRDQADHLLGELVATIAGLGDAGAS